MADKLPKIRVEELVAKTAEKLLALKQMLNDVSPFVGLSLDENQAITIDAEGKLLYIERTAAQIKTAIDQLGNTNFLTDTERAVLNNIATEFENLNTLQESFETINTTVSSQEIRIGQLEGLGLFADMPNQKILIRNSEDELISELSVGWLNNEGTTFFYNETTENLELKNDEGTVLSAIPVSAFVANLAGTITITGNRLTLRDSSNNSLSFVDFEVSNIGGMVDALAGKASANHTHAAADITSGTLADARIPQLAPTKINQNSTNRFVTDAEKTAWNAKQAALGYTAANNLEVIKGVKTFEGDVLTPDANRVITLLDFFRWGVVDEWVSGAVYVRPFGATYGTGDGSSYENAVSGFFNIDWVDAKVIVISGTHNQALDVQASNVIILSDPTDPGIIDSQATRATGITVNSRNNVTINSVKSINALTTNLWIRGTSQNCITNDCEFNGSGNQGIQHYNTVTAIHNNAKCNNNFDDGISLHDDASVVINGGEFSGNFSGINTIDNSTLVINGSPVFSGNLGQDVWATAAATPESCLVTINGGTINGIVRATEGAKIIANNCTLGNVDVADVSGTGSFEANSCFIADLLSGGQSTVTINKSRIIQIDDSSSGGAAVVNLTECYVAPTTYNINAILTAKRCLFDGVNATDQLLNASTSSVLSLSYCLFINPIAGKFGLAFRSGSSFTKLQNLTFWDAAKIGRGIFTQIPITVENCIFNNLNLGLFASGATITSNNSCLFANTANTSGTVTQTASQTTDPLFVNPSLLDFRLGAGSSCIGTGLTASELEGIESADFGDSNSLPQVVTKSQTEPFDIGAYIS